MESRNEHHLHVHLVQSQLYRHEKLAGKLGNAKSCGSQMKIPELVTSTGGLNLEDLYGVEDAPRYQPGSCQPASAARRPIRCRSVSGQNSRRTERAKKSSSGDGPWGVPLGGPVVPS